MQVPPNPRQHACGPDALGMQVNQMFSNDWMKAQEYTVPPLLAAGIRVLIYAGDADFICNWMGNKVSCLRAHHACSVCLRGFSLCIP